jgi:RNA polymerase sigma factor (sigma-70 family)
VMKKNTPMKFIDRLMANDVKAQRELIKKFNSRIFMYFRLRIKGEEGYEDLVQEVFTSFFAAIKKNKVTEDQFIAPFIFGIAKRVMYNFFYKKKRNKNIQKKSEEEFEISYDFEEDERLSNEKMNDFIREVIDKKLPDVDKIILKEFYLKENDVGEVAELIGKSRHYVSVRKERALKKIKNEILKTKDLYTN